MKTLLPCDGYVLDDQPRQLAGTCDHCERVTTNRYRNYNGETGYECDHCLTLMEQTRWGDIHA